MFSLNRRQYIVKKSSGRNLYIYQKPNAGLCVEVLAKDGTRSAPAVVFKDAVPGFTAYLGSDDSMHILSQDDTGSLFYLSAMNDSWEIKPVLINRSEELFDRRPKILGTGDGLIFFYLVEKNGRRVLVYQAHTNGEVKAPKAIDRIRKGTGFYTSLDGSGRICVFYNRPSESGDYPVYRILDPVSGSIGDFHPIGEGSGIPDEQIVSFLPEASGTFGLCKQKSGMQKFELIFEKVQPGTEGTLSRAVLAASDFPFSNSSLVNIGSKLIVYWVREEVIYFSVSEDRGMTWARPDIYQGFEGRGFNCVRYLSNSQPDSDLSGFDLPAPVSNVLNPLFADDFMEADPDVIMSEEQTMEEFISSFYESLKLISNGLDEINNSIREADEKIKNLEAKLTGLEAKACQA